MQLEEKEYSGSGVPRVAVNTAHEKSKQRTDGEELLERRGVDCRDL